jgi:hypothetical protein
MTKTVIKKIFFKTFPNNRGKLILNFKMDFDEFVKEINSDRAKYLTDTGKLKGCIEALSKTDEFGNTHWAYLNTYEKQDE